MHDAVIETQKTDLKNLESRVFGSYLKLRIKLFEEAMTVMELIFMSVANIRRLMISSECYITYIPALRRISLLQCAWNLPSVS